MKTGDTAVDRELDMRLTEQSDFVLILTAFSHRTGRPLVVETMTLVDDMRRVRSVQVGMLLHNGSTATKAPMFSTLMMTVRSSACI